MFLSSSDCRAWFAVFLIESVTIVTVNLLSIILFIKNSNLRSRGMYLIINLTVADVLVGGISTFQLLKMVHFYCNIVTLNLTEEGNVVTNFCFYFFPLTSLSNIAVISLERLHATFRPFRHRVIKKRVYWVTISGIWVSAAVVSTAIIILRIFSPNKWNLNYFALWQSYSCLCLFVICVCYTCISIKFFCGAHPQHHGAANRQRKLTVTLLIMTVISLIMWLPYALGSFINLTTNTFRYISFQDNVRWSFSMIALFYANSLVNPLLYAIRMPAFKRALFALFKQRQDAVVPPHPCYM